MRYRNAGIDVFDTVERAVCRVAKTQKIRMCLAESSESRKVDRLLGLFDPRTQKSDGGLFGSSFVQNSSLLVLVADSLELGQEAPLKRLV